MSSTIRGQALSVEHSRGCRELQGATFFGSEKGRPINICSCFQESLTTLRQTQIKGGMASDAWVPPQLYYVGTVISGSKHSAQGVVCRLRHRDPVPFCVVSSACRQLLGIYLEPSDCSKHENHGYPEGGIWASLAITLWNMFVLMLLGLKT